MMKSRPSKRAVWLIIPMIPLIVMGVGAWYAGQPSSATIEMRGIKPPPDRKFSLMNPQSWSVSTEWLYEGMDALMGCEYNPWKHQWKRDNLFGKRMGEMENSDRPEDRAEMERLKNLGREWYKRILARYPDLAVLPDKEIPVDDNGFLQWQQFLQRLGEKKEGGIFEVGISEEIVDHLRKQAQPDMEAIKAWLDLNRTRIDEIRKIALLPGRSSAGMTEKEVMWGASLGPGTPRMPFCWTRGQP